MIKLCITIFAILAVWHSSAFAEELHTNKIRNGIYKTLECHTDLYGKELKNATELLLATAAVESDLGNGVYNKRHGIFQVMPVCEQAVLKNLSKKDWQKLLKLKRKNLRQYHTLIVFNYYKSRFKKHNIVFPDYKDASQQAYLWKKYYNTYLGKGTKKVFLHKAKKYEIGRWKS